MNKVLFRAEAYSVLEGRPNFSRYTHIRAYHGCRPLNEDDYRKKGIYPLDKLNEKKYLRKLCGLTHCSFQQMEKYYNQERDESVTCSVVFVALNRETLLSCSSHYLIYGSELMNAVFSHVGKRDLLKRVGKPTLFVCDIPIDSIPNAEDQLEDIANNLYMVPENKDNSLRLSSIAPSDIVDVEYPTVLPDPYNYNAKYYYKG
jgi:hypothetical protein